MSDDKNQRKRNRSRIALGEQYEVRYWSQKFGVSPEELERAVKAVGNDANKVSEHLSSRSSQSSQGAKSSQGSRRSQKGK